VLEYEFDKFYSFMGDAYVESTCLIHSFWWSELWYW